MTIFGGNEENNLKYLLFSVEKYEGEYPVKVEISPLLSYDGEVSLFIAWLVSLKNRVNEK